MSNAAAVFSPTAADTGAPIKLAMQRLWLGGRIVAAGARLTVQHIFRSDEANPLEVIYSFPLPRDAALRSFRIMGDGFEVNSELKETEDAVREYERGIAEGSLSALARQYGDGIVNLNVGNIRPNETVTVLLELLAGTELRDDGFRFRFPFTLAPAYHPQMRTAVVAPGEGEMELPSDKFGDVILPRFRSDASGLHEVGFELTVVPGALVDEIGSPSHAIRVRHQAAAATVAIAPAKDVPDRDLVLDVSYKQPSSQVFGGPSSAGTSHYAAIVPSTVFGTVTESARRLVIVLDRSGSMQGSPIEQARKAIEACLALLSETDSFGLVAFDEELELMASSLVAGSRKNRDKARAFLAHVDARGGTELTAGFMAAARLLEGGGDVLIFTDGQVSGTEQILAAARSANIRISCLGIGSASQDRFLSLLARETGGVSRFVTARERVDMSAVDLFASIGRPVAEGLKAGGNVQPATPSHVFAGTPVVLFTGFSAGSQESIELTWDGGRLSLPVPAGDSETGETIRLLQGSRLITDWDSRYPSQEALASVDKRKQSRVAARLVELSREYGLASREVSLVAVVKRAGDKPGELPETRVVPVGMPQDTIFSAYFRTATQQFASMPTLLQRAASPSPPPRDLFASLFSVDRETGVTQDQDTKYRGTQLWSDKFFGPLRTRRKNAASQDEPGLLTLAAQLEPDGGMPGKTAENRAARTVAAIFAFISEGHTASSGAFRSHVARLVSFLRSVQGDPQQAIIGRAIDAATTGECPPGNWLEIASNPATTWRQVQQALAKPATETRV